MKPANREFIGQVNLFNILNSIREAGLISRVEIAERAGQSRALAPGADLPWILTH